MKRIFLIFAWCASVLFSASAGATGGYSDGAITNLYTVCPVINVPTTAVGAYTGFYLDTAAPYPRDGEISYIHAYSANISGCVGDVQGIKFGLPAYASFAISSAYPVSCVRGNLSTGTTVDVPNSSNSSCLQTPQIDGGGAAFFGYAQVPSGYYLEIKVPVLWSAASNGHTLSAQISSAYGTAVATKTVTVYAAPSKTLTVSKSGNGTVTSSPAGISCGATCSASFASGSSVTLTAAPSPGWAFAGWSGGCASGIPTCTVAMTQAQSVTAYFGVPMGSLTVTLGGLPPGVSSATLKISGPPGFNTTPTIVNGTGQTYSDVPLGSYTVSGPLVPSGGIVYAAPTKVAQVIDGGNVTVDMVYAARPAAADLSGDRKADIVWQHTSNASAVWLMNGTAKVSAATLLPSGTPWSVVRVADFNGDGKADILWQHTDGTLAIWLMNGTAVTGSAIIPSPGSGWALKEVGDFNGDGKADLLWQHTDGTVMMWLMNGTVVSSSTIIKAGGSGWGVKKVGDFDGDGKTDIVWEHSSGQVALWLMNGTATKSSAVIYSGSPGWSVRDVGDFDGDGKSDLLWQHTSGAVAMWVMDGVSVVNAVSLFSGSNGWSVKQLADFNGDGKADILWQYSDGSIAIWLMNGVSVSSSAIVPNGGTGWTIKAVADYNGDGKADILLQQSDGSVTMWLMNGTSILSGVVVFAPQVGWSPLP